MNNVIKEETKLMEKFDLNMAGEKLYSFIWTDFCDKYIEISKFNQNNTTKSVLLLVLTNILKMMHPFTPFITDEIYNMLPIKDAENIMISKYPIYNKEYHYAKEEHDIDDMLEFITLFRNKKAEINTKDYEVIVNNDNLLAKQMLKIMDKVCENSSYSGKLEVTYKDYTYVICYDNTLSEEDKNNYLKEKERLINSIERRKKLLSNPGYLSKAPEKIVSKEKEDLINDEKQLEIILNLLK